MNIEPAALDVRDISVISPTRKTRSLSHRGSHGRGLVSAGPPGRRHGAPPGHDPRSISTAPLGPLRIAGTKQPLKRAATH